MKLELKYNNSREGGAIFETELELTKEEYIIKDVPEWDSIYIYSSNCINKGSSEQKSFYFNEFKPNILNGEPIKLDNNENYGFIFLFDLLDDFNNGLINDDLLIKTLNLLIIYYPFFKEDALRCLVNFYELRGDWEKGWETIITYQTDKRNYDYVFNHNLRDYYIYSKKLNKNLINAENIFDFFYYPPLTEFGKRNQSEILHHFDLILNEEIEKKGKANFWEIFIKNDEPFKMYSKKYYKEIIELTRTFEITDELLHIWSFDRTLHRRFPLIIESSIESFIQMVLKECENKYRRSLGLTLVDEGEHVWKNEANLYELIKSEFKDEEIIHQASPFWLLPQSFDIYFPKKNIAIEYQGRQHYKPIEIFGGEEGFEKTKVLDRKKRKLSKENNCILIYVDEGYNQDKIIDIIKSELEKRENVFFEDDYLNLKVPIKQEPELVISKQIFDCKKEQIISFKELNKKFNGNLKLGMLKRQDSLYGRYVLLEKKNTSKTVKRWKNIIDMETGEINRYSMKSFASKVGTTENSVWRFFNGKQKKIYNRYMIKD